MPQTLQGAVEHGQCPASIEDRFRRARVHRLEQVSSFGGFELERQRGGAATSFLCPAVLCVVEEEVLERRQKKRSEAAALLPRIPNVLFVEEAGQERLRQVLRVL